MPQRFGILRAEWLGFVRFPLRRGIFVACMKARAILSRVGMERIQSPSFPRVWRLSEVPGLPVTTVCEVVTWDMPTTSLAPSI